MKDLRKTLIGSAGAGICLGLGIYLLMNGRALFGFTVLAVFLLNLYVLVDDVRKSQ